MSEAIVRAQALTKRYGNAIAVDRLDLAIEEGEVFGLLGPNGAGKTTTILMLLGLTEPSSGTARVAGFDPLRQPLEVKRRTGYMPDQLGFYDNLSGVTNLEYTARLAGLPRGEIAGRIDAALGRVNLTEAARKRVATYSRGMRQRLAVAEILVKRAQIAILDEPTSGLDPQSTREFHGAHPARLRRRRHGRSISPPRISSIRCSRSATVSHLFNVARRIGLTWTRRGSHERRARRLACDPRPTPVGNGLAEAVRKLSRGVKRAWCAESGHLLVETQGDLRAAIARTVVAAGGDLLTIAANHASLDDVYTRYFEGARDAA